MSGACRWSEHPLEEERARSLAEELRRGSGVKALVHLAALSADPPAYGAVRLAVGARRAPWVRTWRAPPRRAARQCSPRPARRGLRGGHGRRDGVGTELDSDGAPGSDAAPERAAPGSFEQGAIPGFLKTLAHEWPQVRIKAVDLSTADPAQAAADSCSPS